MSWTGGAIVWRIGLDWIDRARGNLDVFFKMYQMPALQVRNRQAAAG